MVPEVPKGWDLVWVEAYNMCPEGDVAWTWKEDNSYIKEQTKNAQQYILKAELARPLIQMPIV